MSKPKSKLSDSSLKSRQGLEDEQMPRESEAETPPPFSHSAKGRFRVRHFSGLALGGGKTDKTCLALLEYYPQHNKIFLSHLYSRIKSEEELSADQQIYQLLSANKQLESLAIDTPLKLPKCLRCRLKCPGYEKCGESEIKWMWKFYREKNIRKRPAKLFTPYTERCAELYISSSLEEEFHPPHAVGSNMAPLTARALFLQRRLSLPMMEVYPKLSLWRIGRALGIAMSHLRYHKHAIGGEESREAILDLLIKKNIAFIYEQDAKIMIEFSPAFDAFICALTGYLKFKGQTEPRPKAFPKSEAWIEYPKSIISW